MGTELNKETTAEDTGLVHSPADWFLQFLVHLVNTAPGHYLGITLNVGGSLISGELVSGKLYFEGFANELADGMKQADAPAPDEARAAIASYAEIYDDTNISVSETHYIHLRNAQFFWPGQVPVPMNRPVWWRGRIEAVDGFVLGLLSAVRG